MRKQIFQNDNNTTPTKDYSTAKTPMTPNTRQRKNPLANNSGSIFYFQALNLDNDDRYETSYLLVVKLSMQNLNMICALQSMKKPAKKKS